ncbi:MAG: YbaK/EbsC family protein [Kurthia sp.]|nr:YbaK/EbsC family protein [Candidatus Kurthia equi]
MAIEKVHTYFKQFQMEDQILTFEASTATVQEAAAALGCEPARIAKSLTFSVGEDAILIVAAGDAKVDNSKFKAHFGVKARMLKADEVEPQIGHAIGGVCPFAVNEDVTVYLDESLKRFDTVFPACGSSNSAIELTIAELDRYSNNKEWVDVFKGW